MEMVNQSLADQTVPLIPPGLFTEDLVEKRPKSTTIAKSREQIFSFIRDFKNHPRFMEGFVGDANDVVVEKMNELMVWRSYEKDEVSYLAAFALVPASGDRGTVVTLKIAPEGDLAKFKARIEKLTLDDPDSFAYRSLRHLKALLETGEVPTTAGQPSGREEDLVTAKH